MRLLSPTVHGYIDYFVVILFACAPMLFGFAGVPATLCYVLAAVHLTMTLLTAFPLGVLKVVPFPIHGAIEAVVVLALAVFPWLLGFAEVHAARNFFLFSAAAIAIVVALTNYRAAELPRWYRWAHA
jgi:hypothetical protein